MKRNVILCYTNSRVSKQEKNTFSTEKGEERKTNYTLLKHQVNFAQTTGVWQGQGCYSCRITFLPEPLQMAPAGLTFLLIFGNETAEWFCNGNLKTAILVRQNVRTNSPMSHS